MGANTVGADLVFACHSCCVNIHGCLTGLRHQTEQTQTNELLAVSPSLGLWELCSKSLSLFYSEFLLKSLHYAQFYSFYATDSIIILAIIKLLTLFLLYS